MEKAIVQYKLPGIVTLPEGEGTNLPAFLADYLKQHSDEADIIHVAPYVGRQAHICDLEDSEGTYIDIVLPLAEEHLESPATHYNEIDGLVNNLLKELSFVVTEQVQCLNERFYVLEPYGSEE